MLEPNQNRSAAREGTSPSRKGAQANAQNHKQTTFQLGGNDNQNDSGTGSKKRTREEMMNPGGSNGAPGMINSSIFNMQGGLGIGNSGSEGQAIEKMIMALREKVLNGETLNHFKREIA